MGDPRPGQLLELADRHYRGAGAREQAMCDELDLSATQFARLLYAVVTNPPAEVGSDHQPVTAPA